jgi:aminoglycoside phosphotransferase (APT) family kinase protein
VGTGRLDPELSAFARECVRDAVGPSSREPRLELIAASAATVAVRITLPGRRLLLKTTADPAVDFARTAAVMELARASGVPVPEVLAARTGTVGQPGHLLQLHVEGYPWREVSGTLGDDDLGAVQRRLAEMLLAVQTISFAGFGELDAAARSPGVDLVTALQKRAELRVADSTLRDRFCTLLDREARLFEGGTATLAHDDLHHGNVLVTPDGGNWRLAGVIDWDKAWAGPAESDLARMAFWDDMTGQGFWDVYRAAVPEADGWPRRALVHQLLWCLEYPAPTERHRADTAAVAQAVGFGGVTPGSA